MRKPKARLLERDGRERSRNLVLRPLRDGSRRGAWAGDVHAFPRLVERGAAGAIGDVHRAFEKENAVGTVDRTCPKIGAADADRGDRRDDGDVAVPASCTGNEAERPDGGEPDARPGRAWGVDEPIDAELRVFAERQLCVVEEVEFQAGARFRRDSLLELDRRAGRQRLCLDADRAVAEALARSTWPTSAASAAEPRVKAKSEANTLTMNGADARICSSAPIWPSYRADPISSG